MSAASGAPADAVTAREAVNSEPQVALATGAPIRPAGGPLRGRLASRPLLVYLIRRVAAGSLTLVGASLLIFMAIQVLPGNAAEVALGKRANPERIKQLSDQLHLNDPLLERYWRFLSGFLSGNLGTSTSAAANGTNQPVSELVFHPLINSLTIALIALIVIVPIGLVLGSAIAYRNGTIFDQLVSGASVVFSSMPEFLAATLLITVFYNGLNVLPPVSEFDSSGWAIAHPKLLVLPITTLTVVCVGVTARLVRAETIEVLRRNYVAVARINRVRESRVFLRYVSRNSLAPSVQALGMTAQYLIGGIVIVESVFAFPGIGALLVNAVETRDVQVISVTATILASIYIIINIVTDIIVTILSPRLRTNG